MIALVFTVVAIFIALYYAYYFAAANNAQYWKRRGIEGPESKNKFLHFTEDLLNPNYNSCYLLRDWTKKYGKIYGIMEGWRKVLVIADYKLAHEVLVKKFEIFHARKLGALSPDNEKEKGIHVFNASGSRWKRLRTIINPCFSVNSLKLMFNTVDDSCKVMLSLMDKEYEADNAFNIHKHFHELTMDVISRIAMGQKGTKQFNNPNVEVAKAIFQRKGIVWLDDLAHMFPFAGHYFFKSLILIAKLTYFPVKQMLDDITAAVEERKKQRAKGINATKNNELVDFIDLFIDAEAENIKDDAYSKSNVKIEKKMTTEEIVQQCFLFLLAGFDTTANTLAISTWLLAKHPDVQQQLIDEIDDICTTDEITYEQVNELRFCDVVMKEALRLYPIATFVVGRECVEPTKLGNVELEKGVYVMCDVLSMHYDKNVWGENAEEFYPERFFDFSVEQQMSYYPFGGGPRVCVGMRLAYMEQKMALARILKKYKFVQCPETEKELKLTGCFVLNPDSVTIKLEKR
jgi:cytochrome P450 family 13